MSTLAKHSSYSGLFKIGIPNSFSLIVIEHPRKILTVFFSQSCNKLFWCNNSDLFLLCGDIVEQVCQASQHRFLTFGRWFIRQNFLSKRFAEVQRLQNRIAVTGISKLKQRVETRHANDDSFKKVSKQLTVSKIHAKQMTINMRNLHLQDRSNVRFAETRLCPFRAAKRWHPTNKTEC